MKVKIMLVGVVLALAGSLYIFAGYIQAKLESPTNGLKIELSAGRASFSLGEAVPFDVTVQNDSGSDVLLPGVSLESGFITVWIADLSGKYAEYKNAAWGNEKRPPVKLKAGRGVASRATVLANSKPETAHLSEDWARRISDESIMTSYAFPKAGTYYVKVVLRVAGEAPGKIESNPIQITITEPIGEDLEVWNKIRDRSDFAYFMQEGQLTGDDKRVTGDFVSEVDRLIASYPNSILANQLKIGREKFRTNEEKRREMKERVKDRTNN